MSHHCYIQNLEVSVGPKNWVFNIQNVWQNLVIRSLSLRYSFRLTYNMILLYKQVFLLTSSELLVMLALLGEVCIKKNVGTVCYREGLVHGLLQGRVGPWFVTGKGWSMVCYREGLVHGLLQGRVGPWFVIGKGWSMVCYREGLLQGRVGPWFVTGKGWSMYTSKTTNAPSKRWTKSFLTLQGNPFVAHWGVGKHFFWRNKSCKPKKKHGWNWVVRSSSEKAICLCGYD